MSWARSVSVFAMAFLYKEIKYLVIKSTDDEGTSNDTVRMAWNQVVEIRES